MLAAETQVGPWGFRREGGEREQSESWLEMPTGERGTHPQRQGIL